MNTLTWPLSAIEGSTPAQRQASDPYASEAHTAALLRFGAQYRVQRIQASDMVTTDEAAELTGTTRVPVNAWIKAGRCVGVAHLRRGYKLPRWQFEPFIFPVIQPLSQALGLPTDGSCWRFWKAPTRHWTAKHPARRWSKARPYGKL